MIKGLYSSFTALEAAWRYQDILANNIANANTVGYKREVAAQESFADVLLSQQAPVPAPLPARIQQVVGQIGTGTFVAEFATDFTNGALQQTGNELDLATGRGFFVVETPGGERYYTRDGRFGRDANGDLVTAHGYHVLDAEGERITLPAEPVAVDPAGVITAEGEPVAQLMLLDFTPNQLVRSGESYFAATAPGVAIEGDVRQGFLERSNTELVDEMTTLLAVQRTYQANQTVLSTLDGTLQSATGELGTFGA